MEYIRKKIAENRWKYLSSITVFIFTLVYAAICNITKYNHDASYYWDIANNIFSEGKIKLYNFPETFRGYFFPAYIQVIKSIGRVFGSEIWAWRISISVCMTAFYAILVPYILNVKYVLRSYIGIIISIIISFYFWGQFFQYPLSDFYALFFLVLSIASIKYAISSSSMILRVISSCVAGVSAYGAYNTRVSFLYSVVLLSIIFMIRMIKRRMIKKCLLCIICFVVGVIVVMVPQMMINKHYLGYLSPKVFTSSITDYSRSLELEHIILGIQVDRADGYIEEAAYEEGAFIYYWDKSGMEIVRREGEVEDIGDYLQLYTKYPLDMLGVDVRHSISLLIPTSCKVFNDELHINRGIYTLIILMWIVTICSLFSAYDKSKLVLFMIVVAVCVPNIMQLFGQVELRFFLGPHLLMYFYVCVCINYKKLWEYTKGKRGLLAVLVVTVYLLAISIYGDILSNNAKRTYLINDCNYDINVARSSKE